MYVCMYVFTYLFIYYWFSCCYLSKLSLSEHLDELEILAWELEGREIDWWRRRCRSGRRLGVQQVGGGVRTDDARQQWITCRTSRRQVVRVLHVAAVRRRLQWLAVTGQRRRERQQAGRRRGRSDHEFRRFRISAFCWYSGTFSQK